MDDGFSIQICGDAGHKRTKADVFLADNLTEPWAMVYDSPQGWVVEIQRPPKEEPLPWGAQLALEAAKERLSLYVNRRGENAPANLSLSALSVWLMRKETGPAMAEQA